MYSILCEAFSLFYFRVFTIHHFRLMFLLETIPQDALGYRHGSTFANLGSTDRSQLLQGKVRVS